MSGIVPLPRLPDFHELPDTVQSGLVGIWIAAIVVAIIAGALYAYLKFTWQQPYRWMRAAGVPEDEIEDAIIDSDWYGGIGLLLAYYCWDVPMPVGWTEKQAKAKLENHMFSGIRTMYHDLRIERERRWAEHFFALMIAISACCATWYWYSHQMQEPWSVFWPFVAAIAGGTLATAIMGFIAGYEEWKRDRRG